MAGKRESACPDFSHIRNKDAESSIFYINFLKYNLFYIKNSVMTIFINFLSFLLFFY